MLTHAAGALTSRFPIFDCPSSASANNNDAGGDNRFMTMINAQGFVGLYDSNPKKRWKRWTATSYEENTMCHLGNTFYPFVGL